MRRTPTESLGHSQNFFGGPPNFFLGRPGGGDPGHRGDRWCKIDFFRCLGNFCSKIAVEIKRQKSVPNISVRVLGGPDLTEKFGEVFISLTKKG